MHAGHGRPPTLDIGWTAALCGGVLAQLYAPGLIPKPWAVLLLVVALVAGATLIAFAHRRVVTNASTFTPASAWPRAVAMLLSATLGASLCALHGHAALSERLPTALDDARLQVELRVVGLPESQPQGAYFVAEIERVVEGDAYAAKALEGRRVALRWYGGGRALRPGERWRLVLRLRPWTPSLNPGDPDAMRRALVDGVVAQGQVQIRERPLRLGAPQGLHAVRDAVSRRALEALGSERSRFVAALAVGDTRGLSDDDWDRLRQFGLTHLIAISGFHVGMVAGLGVLAVRALWWLWPPLAYRWRRRPAAAVAAVLVAIGYAGLAGFSLPTVRTGLMVGVVAMVACRRQRTSFVQPLLLAIAVLALADPFALLTPGFWLSCGGVAWLLWCLPRETDPWSFRAFLKAQWVATLGLLPFAAGFFLQVPVAGPLANLVAIPWISLVVVPLSLLGTLLMPVSNTLSALAWQASAAAMAGLWALLTWVPDALAASRWLPEVAAWTVVLALLGVAIALLPRGLPWRHAGWLLVLPMLFPPRVMVPKGEFAVIAFAVPRGDALLVRTASATVLVDAGPAAFDLTRRLRALGVERIDLRIETRSNAGRKGGIAAVDAAFPPASRWLAPGSGIEASPDAARCEAGQRWAVEGVEILVVSPAPGSTGATTDDACVLQLTDASGHRAWLTSDAGRWVARRLAASSRGGWVFGAPAALEDWRSATGSETGIATRAPGPSLSQRWPMGLHRVDESGALEWRSGPAQAQRVLHDIRPRWWHAPPR
jgi:competence protein ComEC